MKAKTTLNITGGQFDDVRYANDLVVVEKSWNDHLSHTTVFYVYETVESKMPLYGVFQEITEDGAYYWKEIYNA